jgi:hypothetical protein
MCINQLHPANLPKTFVLSFVPFASFVVSIFLRVSLACRSYKRILNHKGRKGHKGNTKEILVGENKWILFVVIEQQQRNHTSRKDVAGF